METLDIIRGAEDIALFLFGDKKKSKIIYRLHESNKLPTFKIGLTICMRPTTFVKWIEAEESRAMGATA